LNTLSLSWWRSLEPSPISTHKSDAWKYFSGVIKHVFDEEGEGNDVLVAPTIAQGNTDTKYYVRSVFLLAWHILRNLGA
jgi:Gly-Xaa carboxypeptidase